MKITTKVAAAALLALSAVPAMAADFAAVPAPLESAAPRLTRPAYSSFDGFFVGAHVGGAFRPGTSLNTATGNTAVGVAIPGSTSFAGRSGYSAFFGGFAGYNWTWGNYLLGAEFSGDYAPNSQHWSGFGVTNNGVGVPPTVTTARYAMKLDGALQTRAKFGYLISPSIAAYGFTGIGVDFVQFRVQNAGVVGSASAAPATFGVGAGVEWMAFGNFGIRSEYEYRRAFNENIYPGLLSYNTGRHMVRLGATYLFR